VNPELEALLVVQRHDEGIRAIEARRDSVVPRLAVLDKTRKRVADEAQRAEAALERELERHRALEARIAEHRARHEKNLGVLNQAHKLKEATAAMAQVETARRVLAEEESELLGMSRRITDLRTSATTTRDAVASLEVEQVAARAAIEAERGTIETEIAAARALRDASAGGVTPQLLSKYDRLQARRRAAVVFALGTDFSCGNCDTSIPMQRRPSMASGNVIETCEGCGALLYLQLPASGD
jgi:predicted  nucleic acid-binding Zn-ribbon protein